MSPDHQNEDSLPSGVVTALFTDIVGSTVLKGKMPGETSGRRDAAYRREIKEPHDAIVLRLIAEHKGNIVNPTGDGYCAVFADAEEAVLCAIKMQEQLTASAIPTPLGPLQVRIGLHTGMATASGGDIVAATMDKAARVQSKADGKRVLVSRETPGIRLCFNRELRIEGTRSRRTFYGVSRRAKSVGRC